MATLDEFEMGKQYIIEALDTLLSLYIKLPIGLGLLGLGGLFYDKSFDMNLEKARLAKLSLDTLMSSLKKAENTDEVRKAIEENQYLNQLLKM